MTRAKFYDTSFTNCNFIEVALRASDFDSCKLKKTTFSQSNLDLILVKNVKVWELQDGLKSQIFLTSTNRKRNSFKRSLKSFPSQSKNLTIRY